MYTQVTQSELEMLVAERCKRRYWHRRHSRSFRLTIDSRITGGPFQVKLRGTGTNIITKIIKRGRYE